MFARRDIVGRVVCSAEAGTLNLATECRQLWRVLPAHAGGTRDRSIPKRIAP